MGVHGLTKLLNQEGFLPSNSACRQPLWRDTSTSITRSDRIVCIPAGSTLAIDGNGLAYYLHRVAYSRYFATQTKTTGTSTISSKTTNKDSFCSCPSLTKLSEQQVTQLLPEFMPLSLLEQVTNEFVQSLLRHRMTLQIYWDGDGRRFKAQTLHSRKAGRDDEWGQLQQYCLYGVVSSTHNAKKKTLCQRDWVSNYPMSRLMMAQVQSTLEKVSSSFVTMIQCEGEADMEVARAASGRSDVYCVGLDTDYLLFPHVQYVPLNTIHVSASLVTGSVLLRSQVAEHLDLALDEHLVEMALLMGTDFVPDPSVSKLNYKGSFKVEAILEHLRNQEPDYHVSSELPEVQLAINYTRTLCSFGDVSTFPLDDDGEEKDVDTNQEEEDDEEMNRPRFPEEVDLSLVILRPLDLSIPDVVLRQLQPYVDASEEQASNCLVQQEHLDAFQKTTDVLGASGRSPTETVNFARPEWKDVLAAYVIERCLAYIFRTNPAAPAVTLTSPSKLFDHSLFHSILKSKRIESNQDSNNPKQGASFTEEPKKVERAVLPIDEHEEDILTAVETQRVTIIHGETGCGKSSRVPVMLLRAPPPDPTFAEVKMFISQPRRIAAKSLVERVRSCEPDIRDSIALRMGHGVREYENPKTRAWFVTTGYLVRLLANHPERFNECSHLIIDEVHERSIDTDLLCLLCRRLLSTNSRIRLILMSATMAAKLYQQYFNVPVPPIHVGARRFPIREFFVEDIMKSFRLPPGDTKVANSILKDCDNLRCASAPPNSYMDNLFRLTVRVVATVGRPGGSILIFVPGMNEIISIADLIERLYVAGLRYTCFPIHSDVPFDEQMSAFDSPAADEVKVIIATNAAESSVTLPDVDHVICLGLCKQIIYNPTSHRQMLMPTWISRASAIQRAGRTGRVRVGNVYRLYTRNVFEQHMDMFETGEMLRVPLDSVILTLKEMLKEEATPILLQCLEPPDLSTIQRSFQSLCRSNFITKPNDQGDITTLGAFVSSLGIDLSLGSLIGLGIQFGVGAEAVEMAAVLSFPKTPWLITNPLYHEASTFNDITARTYISKCHFDANLYSDPFAIMNLMWDYERATNQNGWARHYSVSAQRLRRLLTTRNSLRNRVADFAVVPCECLRVEQPPVKMPHAKLTILRVLQTWVFSDTMIESIQAATSVDGAVTLVLAGDPIDDSHLHQVLDPDRHNFQLLSHRQIEQNGSFSPVLGYKEEFEMETFLIDFETRLLSYVAENEYEIVYYTTETELILIVRDDITHWQEFAKVQSSKLKNLKETFLAASPLEDANRRGRQERACGSWNIRSGLHEIPSQLSNKAVLFRRWQTNNDTKLVRYFKKHIMDMGDITRTLSCTLLNPKRKKKGRPDPRFCLELRGKCTEVTKVDLCDIFGTPAVTAKTHAKSNSQQNVTFSLAANAPLEDFGSPSGSSATDTNSSWNRPLLQDIPEGVRLLSVLASGRRKDHIIEFSPPNSFASGRQDEKKQDSVPLVVSLNRKETKISQRWRQFASDKNVYVGENSVPASALQISGPAEVFACCANTLEVRGGGLRVEGLTLLPPGRFFLLLSFLSFGLRPFTFGSMFDDEEYSYPLHYAMYGGEQESAEDALVRKSLKWLSEWDDMVEQLVGVPQQDFDENDREDRIRRAVAFHESCSDLGESLICHSEKVKELCALFDLVDGYEGSVWDSLPDNPFVKDNLAKHRASSSTNRESSRNAIKRNDRMKQQDTVESQLESANDPVSTDTPVSKREPRANSRIETKKKSAEKKGEDESRDKPRGKSKDGSQAKDTVKNSTDESKPTHVATLMKSYTEDVVKMSDKLFATQVPAGERIGDDQLPSTNILAILAEHYRDMALRVKKDLSPVERGQIELDGSVCLTQRHWKIYTLKDKDGRDWFTARFVNEMIPLIPLRKRGHGDLPGWMSQGRPSRPNQAFDCAPAQFGNIPYLSRAACLDGTNQKEKILFYNSIETALRMEAAFYLERQFRSAYNHWYTLPLDELMEKMTESLLTKSSTGSLDEKRLALGPTALEELTKQSGDVNSLSKKQISAILWFCYSKRMNENRGKPSLVAALEQQIAVDPSKIKQQVNITAA